MPNPILLVNDAGHGETPVPSDALLKPGDVLNIHNSEDDTQRPAKCVAVAPVGVPVEYAIADQTGTARPLMITNPAHLLRIAVPSQDLVSWAKLRAAKLVFDGRDSPASRRYLIDCRHYHSPTQCNIIYTRDTGHHSSGWWKNPDFERCYHLSMSFVAYERGQAHALPFDKRIGAKWATAFFGSDVDMTWIEPPYTEVGKSRDVYHYRLFCDEAWSPIKPRGEVYSKDWTPSGWKSFSDLHGATPEAR
ncbi:MAG: hypothetical protein EOR08_08080 [Mesorhizobium sp.]|nr:MAG: hypothetical protein EOR08_08080 [Mesorhizobium sp.]